VAVSMFASGGNAEQALHAAEKAGDTLLMAQAADAAGLAAWRRYEPIAKRGLASDGRPIDLSMMSNIRRDRAVDYLGTFVKRIEPPTGNTDYATAVELFRRALAADPTNTRIARHLYMTLGEREQWAEMLATASRRATLYPLDYQSQLALGLAAHRLGEDKEAQRAFDSALVLMDEESRVRMTSLSRILRPSMMAGDSKKRRDGVGDSAAFAKLPQAQRDAVANLYWLMADPLSLTQENEHRNEFMARVTWADFRWTTEDQGLLGADTDRGDIYIRYGPPSIDMTVPGKSDGSPGAGVTVAWIYPNERVFFFDLMPGFLSARTSFFDKDYVEQIRNAIPVDFANVPATRMLDTIPVMITRFRARGDSTDVVVAAAIPVDSMVRGLPMDRAPIDIDVRLFDQFAMVRGVESAQTTVSPDTVRAPLGRDWVRRIGPGLNLLRVEALQADSRRAARSLSRIEPDIGSGFGMSDILLGSAPSPREGVVPRGWRDIETTPSAGSFSRARIGLVWEIYELTNTNGQANYTVDISVERITKGLGGFTARVVDGVGRTVGREARGVNKLAISFPRTAAAASTMIEYLTINLADASSGDFRLDVTVTDQRTRRKTTRTTTFRIR
jgi:GWxTD domain-containing protein